MDLKISGCVFHLREIRYGYELLYDIAVCFYQYVYMNKLYSQADMIMNSGHLCA